MANILMATLGESPVVISAMTSMLEWQCSVKLDEIQIIYPNEPNERWIEIGFEMLKEHLEDRRHEITGIPLDFDDVRTEKDCFEFLIMVDGYLEGHDRAGNNVYLSIAGGRKHTSALLALMPQFHTCVKGLYHLHDISAQHLDITIEKLERSTPEFRQAYFQPQSPDRKFRLIKLPSEPLAEPKHLRQWLRQAEQTEGQPPVLNVLPPAGSESLSFWSRLFHNPESPVGTVKVLLSQTAFDEYCAARQRKNGLDVETLDVYLKDMNRLDWYRDHCHHRKRDTEGRYHYVLKKARTSERIFCYFLPQGSSPAQHNMQKVVVTAFTKHNTEKSYERDLKDWVKRGDTVPVKRLSDLPERETVLVAILGETPMVVTQAYALMTNPACHVPPLKVIEIRLVYPEGHAPARKGANLLEKVCSRHRVELKRHGLPIKDLDSDKTITRFTQGLRQTVNRAHAEHPNANVVLLLSGGRKGMSALGFYVAQTQPNPRIQQVYFTTVPDPQKEQMIETNTKNLDSMPPQKQENLLFLKDEELFPENSMATDFTLLSVPVIHLSQ